VTTATFQIVLNTVLVVLVLFFVVMWARLVVDWVRVLQPNWRPHGLGLIVAEVSFTITDPPIRVVRRIIPTLKIGPSRLEFSWSIVMLACLVLIWFVGLLR
jgi:YggT family protein